MENVKESRKGCKAYTHWMASWREEGKMRASAGSARKRDAEKARRKTSKRDSRRQPKGSSMRGWLSPINK
jgi:hypothetical protein